MVKETKEVKYSNDARLQLKSGLDKLANAVKVTLGPKGRNVLIETKTGPHITKDGVTVARAFELSDKFENMGVQVVKQVSQKTADIAGDGTTTATVLAQTMAKYGFDLVNAGVNPISIKNGMELALKHILTELDKQTIHIGNDYERIKQVATISANNDSTLGELIADAFKMVGNDGVVTVEESRGVDTTIEMVDGLQFDRGYLSGHFITNQEKLTAHLENPYILLYDGVLSNMNDILPLFESIIDENRGILIVADDLSPEVLSTLVVNKTRGVINVAAVKSPSFGEFKKEMMQDIATLTGGKFITPSLGHKLSNVTIEWLGECEKVVIDKNSTTIVNGVGVPTEIDNRINGIKKQIELAQNDYEREKLQDRLSKLSGGVAVLYIGAGSEIELKEKKDRVDDALQATRAAIKEGIVKGGGVALLECEDVLYQELLSDKDSLGETASGIEVVVKSLSSPIRQILKNSGLEVEPILYKLLVEKSDDYDGYDAKNNKFTKMLNSGIIDPKLVTRTAIQNAISVISTLLTTECIMVNEENK